MIASQNNFNGGWVFVINLIKDRIGSDYSDFQYIVTLTKSVGQQWAVFGETQGIKSDFYADYLSSTFVSCANWTNWWILYKYYFYLV